MNIALVLLHFFLLGTPLQDKNPKQLISCHFKEIPFSAFCDSIFNKTGVKVYFQKSWVTNLKVTIETDSIAVKSAVNIALTGSALEVSVWNNDLVILPGEKLITELPDYERYIIINDTSASETKTLTKTEQQYMTGRKAESLQTIKIGNSDANPGNAKVKILGKIIEQETGEPIIGATMYIEETNNGTISDIHGYISMILKPGHYNARFECLGLEKINYLLEVNSEGNFSIEMKKSVIPMQEVIVFGDRQINIKSRDPGLEKISVKTIKEIPMMLGERDILKVSVMLPGIVSVGEGSSGLNVRGGNSDQNAFYINKVPIYNTSHLFGFFPAFNSDIIKDFSIYKGHIPAQYGGKLSSVFNIITRQGNRRRFGASGGINPVTASITMECPVRKDVASILFSARSSYSDWILSRIDDPVIRKSSAKFNDFTGSFNYDFKRSQLSLFVYNSNDKFRLGEINSYEYSNNGASSNLRFNFNTSLHGEFALVASQYSFKTIDEQEVSASYQHQYKINHYEARLDFNHTLNDKNTLDYGANFILYILDRGSKLPYGSQSLVSPLHLGKEQGLENSLYFSDNYDFLPGFNLTCGLRYSLFTPVGPGTVYSYTPGLSRDTRYINDTLNYSTGSPLRWYHSPEVRVALNYETDINGSIKLAFNQMHQNIFMLNNTITIAPNTQWKLADYHLRPSASNQISLGIFRNLVKGGFETSLEIYYKKTNDFPEFKDGADFLSSPNVETVILQGQQKAYGIEFSLKRTARKLDGWLSYTYSHSTVKVDGEHSWDRINGGEKYPANFNIPHVLNALVNYHLTRRINFSSVIAYQSGKPITYPLALYYINGVQFVDYSKRNKYNIPDYFRMDLSLTIEGNLKKQKLVHNSLMFSVYNLTGRKNPYSVYFKSENGKIQSYKYSVIGVPFFTVTWLFKLGNYASD